MTLVADRTLIDQRAVSLAAVVLMRRDDLLVLPQRDNGGGLSLLAGLRRDGVNTGRVFGVVSRGVMADGEAPGREIEGVAGELPFPVCEFVFRVTDDRGWWRWLRRPAGPGGALSGPDTLDYSPLTREGVAALVEAVSGWYEHRTAAAPSAAAATA